jgi:purine-binding chemotaxis protein CheW
MDWAAVWKSLNWDDETRQREAEKEQLRQRARQYAMPVKKRDLLPEDSKTVLTFDLGSEHYGVDVMCVRGVRSVFRLTRVPNTPDFYRGVVNIRGRIVTVMDLRRFFGLAVAETEAPPGELVLVQAHHLEIGLLAHQVNGVTTVPLSAIKPVEHMPYLIGMTGQITVLHIAQLFEDERLIIGGRDGGGSEDRDE